MEEEDPKVNFHSLGCEWRSVRCGGSCVVVCDLGCVRQCEGCQFVYVCVAKSLVQS